MKWFFDSIIKIYLHIYAEGNKIYLQGLGKYEHAFEEMLDLTNKISRNVDSSIQKIHIFFEKYLKAEELEIKEDYGLNPFIDNEIEQLFLKLLFTELSGDIDMHTVLENEDIYAVIPEGPFKQLLLEKRQLLSKDTLFRKRYFEYYQKYNRVSSINGIFQRDLIIPLTGKYIGKLNYSVFELEEEVRKFSCGEKTGNLLILFGNAGQGKSTFVCSYFCRHFYDEKNVFLFKLSEFYSVISDNNELNIHKIFDFYRISKEEMKNSLIIFDGLDEIAGELRTKSIRIREFINRLEEEFYLLGSQCKILITSRPQGIEDKLRGYEKISINGLSYEAQKRWIEKYSGMSGNGSFTIYTLQKIRDNYPDLYALMDTPLLFEIIVSNKMEYEIGNRVELFEKLFQETIITEKSPRAVHRLFENFAYQKFSKIQNSRISVEEAKYLYHQNFVEFYYLSKDMLGIEFVHHSFYQHFLAFYIVNEVSRCLETQNIKEEFLKKIGQRRLDKYEIENISWIARLERLFLNEHDKKEILAELIRCNAICFSDGEAALATANIVFVNCINIINAMSDEVVQLDEPLRKGFNYLLRMYDNYGVQMTHFDLSFYSLAGARFTGADLSGINMTGCDLTRADLCCVNLSNTNLNGSYLRGADLRGANLENADLSECNLSNSYLSGSDLRGANLEEAYLINSNLLASDLKGAKLKNANMRGAILNEAVYDDEELNKAIRTYEQLCAYMQKETV